MLKNHSNLLSNCSVRMTKETMVESIFTIGNTYSLEAIYFTFSLAIKYSHLKLV